MENDLLHTIEKSGKLRKRSTTLSLIDSRLGNVFLSQAQVPSDQQKGIEGVVFWIDVTMKAPGLLNNKASELLNSKAPDVM
jgi:hypothetical protein